MEQDLGKRSFLTAEIKLSPQPKLMRKASNPKFTHNQHRLGEGLKVNTQAPIRKSTHQFKSKVQLPAQNAQPGSPLPMNKAFGQVFTYFIRRNDAKTAVFNLKQFNQNDHKREEEDKIKEQLQSLKPHAMLFDNMPQITFDELEFGWKSIYLGILSPYSNKYQNYIETAIRKAKEEQNGKRISAVSEEERLLKTKRSVTKKPSNSILMSKTSEKTLNFGKKISFEEAKPKPQQSRNPLKASNPLLRNKSLQQNEPTPKNEDQKQLFALSDFKKHLVINELISGRVSRNSQQYSQQFLKNASSDYMASLFKKILIKKAMKRNFDDPQSMGVHLRTAASEKQFSTTVGTNDGTILSGKMFESLNKIQNRVSRAGLDGTLPHFQLELDNFSYLDFHQCASLEIADILNRMHKIKIKKDKHRNCKSMIEGRDFAKNVRANFSDDESDGDLDQEQKEFLEAHHLNRRKSCICKCCGGEDSVNIKKMDKNAMDMLKSEIADIIMNKLKKTQINQFKRQKLERWDKNDNIIQKRRTTLAHMDKAKYQSLAQGNAFLGSLVRKPTIVPMKRKSGVAFIENLSKLRNNQTRKSSIFVRQKTKEEAILTNEDLQMFSNHQDKIEEEYLEEESVSSNSDADNSEDKDEEEDSDLKSSPKKKIAKFTPSVHIDDEESDDDSLKTSYMGSENTNAMNQEVSTANKRSRLSLDKEVNLQKISKISNTNHQLQHQKAKMNQFYNCRDSFKIREYQTLSTDNNQMGKYLSTQTFQRKSVVVMGENGNKLLNKDQLNTMMVKFRKSFKKIQIKDSLQVMSRNSAQVRSSKSTQVKATAPYANHLLPPPMQNLKSRKSSSQHFFVNKYVSTASTFNKEEGRLWTPPEQNKKRKSQTKSAISAQEQLQSMPKCEYDHQQEFFKQRQKLQSQLVNKRSSVISYLSELTSQYQTSQAKPTGRNSMKSLKSKA